MNVEVISKQRVFDGFFKIDRVKLRYEKFGGGMSDVVERLSFERGDSVAAIIFNIDTHKVILTNQFKYPAHQKGPGWITEALAGMIGPDELPQEALAREILEEAGYRMTTATHIGTFYVSPGGSSERIHLSYVEVRTADKVEAGGGLDSEHEDIQLVEWTLSEVADAVDHNGVVDAKTLVGLLWLLRRLDVRSEKVR